MSVRLALAALLGLSCTFAVAAETGLAAVYSDRLQGHTTASMEKFDQRKMTAAHKTLPFGSKVQVTNLKNKKSVVVTINDRGPVQQGRVLDLTKAAATRIGIRPRAMAEVSVEPMSK